MEENELTPDLIAHFGAQLKEKIAACNSELRSLKQAASSSVGETDENDRASNEEERVRVNARSSLLAGIRSDCLEALDRIKNGDYGFCEGTGEPIGIGRLRSMPWVKYSVEYVASNEKRSRQYRV